MTVGERGIIPSLGGVDGGATGAECSDRADTADEDMGGRYERTECDKAVGRETAEGMRESCEPNVESSSRKAAGSTASFGTL